MNGSQSPHEPEIVLLGIDIGSVGMTNDEAPNDERMTKPQSPMNRTRLILFRHWIGDHSSFVIRI
jgi:hypothetical protein